MGSRFFGSSFVGSCFVVNFFVVSCCVEIFSLGVVLLGVVSGALWVDLLAWFDGWEWCGASEPKVTSPELRFGKP